MDYSTRIRKVPIVSELARHLKISKLYKSAVVLPGSAYIVRCLCMKLENAKISQYAREREREREGGNLLELTCSLGPV